MAVDGDPADLAEARESIRLAFIAALQHLPPKQRAVLLLRDVVRWHATEVAELLGTSDASVNSALQRARSTIAASNLTDTDPVMPMDDAQQELLSRYVDAFERYDMESLTSLIHEDAMQSMPPYELWLHGRDEILTFWQTQGAGCAGSRLVPTVANGRPAFGQYRPSQRGDGHDPWALQILDFSDGQLVELSFFLDTEALFPLFGLPPHLPPDRAG
jgi:RNA polymerase sigma-70 factor (ECF subfamily)